MAVADSRHSDRSSALLRALRCCDGVAGFAWLRALLRRGLGHAPGGGVLRGGRLVGIHSAPGGTRGARVAGGSGGARGVASCLRAQESLARSMDGRLCSHFAFHLCHRASAGTSPRWHGEPAGDADLLPTWRFSRGDLRSREFARSGTPHEASGRHSTLTRHLAKSKGTRLAAGLRPHAAETGSARVKERCGVALAPWCACASRMGGTQVVVLGRDTGAPSSAISGCSICCGSMRLWRPERARLRPFQ